MASYGVSQPHLPEGPDVEERREREREIAQDTLERYSGCSVKDFQPYLLLTNFPRYVEYFATSRSVDIVEGSMFKVAHCPKEGISILDFKIGSPAAALAVDLVSFLPVHATLLLGMCGGLRRRYQVGEYFVPVAAIRADGTSDFYFPAEVPALANFVVQKAVTDVLEKEDKEYHIGISHHTNIRFWEFDHQFTERLKATRAQAIEMECATLFVASYKYKLPLGALLLISDLPLERGGVKTKESSNFVYDTFMPDHVETGIRVMQTMDLWRRQDVRGAYRGLKRRRYR